MPKIPYERLAPEANKLIQKMTLARDLQTISYWWDIYVSLLEAAGWDPISFDRETVRRVDEGWDDSKPIVWN
jgi:hypothetical protein